MRVILKSSNRWWQEGFIHHMGLRQYGEVIMVAKREEGEANLGQNKYHITLVLLKKLTTYTFR